MGVRRSAGRIGHIYPIRRRIGHIYPIERLGGASGRKGEAKGEVPEDRQGGRHVSARQLRI